MEIPFPLLGLSSLFSLMISSQNPTKYLFQDRTDSISVEFVHCQMCSWCNELVGNFGCNTGLSSPSAENNSIWNHFSPSSKFCYIPEEAVRYLPLFVLHRRHIYPSVSSAPSNSSVYPMFLSNKVLLSLSSVLSLCPMLHKKYLPPHTFFALLFIANKYKTMFTNLFHFKFKCAKFSMLLVLKSFLFVYIISIR